MKDYKGIKIKNLYLKIVTKKEEPKNDSLKVLIGKEKQSIGLDRFKIALKEIGVEDFKDVTKEHKQQIDIPKLYTFGDEEEQEIAKRVIQENTFYKHQLRSIKNIKPLNIFIRNSINKIDEIGKILLIKENQFLDLLSDCNISLNNTEKLDIYIDSNTIFCSIHGVSIEKLNESLKLDIINKERYDELIKEFNL